MGIDERESAYTKINSSGEIGQKNAESTVLWHTLALQKETGHKLWPITGRV
jgi:hypothetical protein